MVPISATAEPVTDSRASAARFVVNFGNCGQLARLLAEIA